MVLLKVSVCLDVTPCKQVRVYRRFERACRLYPQCILRQSWRYRQQGTPKRW